VPERARPTSQGRFHAAARAGALGLAGLLAAGAAGAAEVAGRVILRNQTLRNHTRNLDRRQMQLRLKLDQELSSRWAATARLTGGKKASPNLSFDEVEEFLGDYPMWFDRANLRWTPDETLWVELGRVGRPLAGSQLLVDVDSKFDGMRLQARRGSWTLRGGAYWLTELRRAGLVHGAFAAQVQRRWGRHSAALGWLDFGDADRLARAKAGGILVGPGSNRSLLGPDVTGDGVRDRASVSEFEIVNLLLEAPLNRDPEGWRAQLELSRNTGAQDRDFGYFLQLSGPTHREKVSATLRSFRIEQDAAVAGFPAENFQGVNVQGWSVMLLRELSPATTFRAWFTAAHAVDAVRGLLPPDSDEIRLDVITRF